MNKPVWPPAPPSPNTTRYDASLKFPPDYDPFVYAASIPCVPYIEYREPVDGTWRGVDGGCKLEGE